MDMRHGKVTKVAVFCLCNNLLQSVLCVFTGDQYDEERRRSGGRGGCVGSTICTLPLFAPGSLTPSLHLTPAYIWTTLHPREAVFLHALHTLFGKFEKTSYERMISAWQISDTQYKPNITMWSSCSKTYLTFLHVSYVSIDNLSICDESHYICQYVALVTIC